MMMTNSADPDQKPTDLDLQRQTFLGSAGPGLKGGSIFSP